MLVRRLDLRERKLLYENNLLKDFHESEVKPFDMIESLIKIEVYECLGFFRCDQLLGYSYLVKPKESKDVFVDYLAVCKENRGRGLGSKFIKELCETLKSTHSTITAEVEDPDFAVSEEDKVNRERRINFYKRNGFSVSGVSSRVLVDRYKIITLSLNRKLSDEKILESIERTYKTIFTKEFYDNHIDVYKEK